MRAGNLTFLPCHYHKQGQGRRHACMHASCRPYVSVVSARQEFIYFPASGIDHVGCVGYQGRLSYYNGGCCISCFVCLQTVVGMVFMGPPLSPHNGRKGRGNITSISLSTLCSTRKGFPPPSVPNCHFCFGNAAGTFTKGSMG